MKLFLLQIRSILTPGLAVGLGLVLLGLLMSMVWLVEAALGEPSDWLEPASVVPTTLGVVITTVTLIMRRSADSLRVAHGLAVGYYFNFIEPVCRAVADPQNALHANGARVVALVVAIPDTPEGIQRENINKVATLEGPDGLKDRLAGFDIREVTIDGGASRKPRAKLVANGKTRKAVVVDIPTTLCVIPEYAAFLCEHGAEKLDEDYAREARTKNLIVQGSQEFRRQIHERGHGEFLNEVVGIGSTASARRLPYPALEIVALSRLKTRTVELIGAT
ncbi:MAG: STING domain-containing protein [Pseudomonadota bacterium]